MDLSESELKLKKTLFQNVIYKVFSLEICTIQPNTKLTLMSDDQWKDSSALEYQLDITRYWRKFKFFKAVLKNT